MKWPWSSRAEAKADRVGAGNALSPAGWAFLPPLQRTIGDLRPTTEPQTFPYELPSWRNPSFTGRMTHAVSAAAPSGVIDGDGAGTGTPTAISTSVGMPVLRPPTPLATLQRQVTKDRSGGLQPSAALTAAVQRTPMPHVEYSAVSEAVTDQPAEPSTDSDESVTEEAPVADAAARESPAPPATAGPITTGYATAGATYLPIPRTPVQRDAGAAVPLSGSGAPSVALPATAGPATPTRRVRLGLGAPLSPVRPTTVPTSPVAVQRALTSRQGPAHDDMAFVARHAAEDPAPAYDGIPAPTNPLLGHPPTPPGTSASPLSDRVTDKPPAAASITPAQMLRSTELPTVAVSRTVAADAQDFGTPAATDHLDDQQPAPSSEPSAPPGSETLSPYSTDHDVLGTPPRPEPPPSQPTTMYVSRAALELAHPLSGAPSAEPDAPLLHSEPPRVEPGTPPATTASAPGGAALAPLPSQPTTADVSRAALDQAHPLADAAPAEPDAALLPANPGSAERSTAPETTGSGTGSAALAPSHSQPAPTASVFLPPAPAVQRLAVASPLPRAGGPARATAMLPPVQRQVGLLTHNPLAATVRVPAAPGAPVSLGGPAASTVDGQSLARPAQASAAHVEVALAQPTSPRGDVLQRSSAASSAGLPLPPQPDAEINAARAEPVADVPATEPESVPEPTPPPSTSIPVDAPGGAGPSGGQGLATPAAGGAAGASTPEQLDDLARRLMGPLTRRLKAEMILDRERRGMRVDRR